MAATRQFQTSEEYLTSPNSRYHFRDPGACERLSIQPVAANSRAKGVVSVQCLITVEGEMFRIVFWMNARL